MMAKEPIKGVLNDKITATKNISRKAGEADPLGNPTTPDCLLQWGNRKRLRCMKLQVKDDTTHTRRRSLLGNTSTSVQIARLLGTSISSSVHGMGLPSLPQLPSSSPPPGLHRVLRNSDNSTAAMRGQSNGGTRRLGSPDINNNKGGASSDIARDNNRAGEGGGSSSGSGEVAVATNAPPLWPPKFVISLTNKEKEEDFFAFKGSKLPQRPKKRAKFVQRTLNLVSPGAWLCDLTLERYEVREKKISKKKPRGLKAMGTVDSDSE